jgi:uncharacterized membrane protein YbaN (DUF454 family)
VDVPGKNLGLKRIVMLVAGWGFVLFGIVGLFLPILQGVLFILIGLLILSSEYVWAHHLLGKLRARFPAASRKADETAEKVFAWMRRVAGQRQ